MSKNKSMKYQIQNILGKAICYGRSKHADKKEKNGYHPHGIYSVSTFNNYVRLTTQFANWAKCQYGCKTMQECRPYINDYLEYYSIGKTASSIHSMKFAIQKLYSTIEPGFKVEYNSPKRLRSEIIKNRHSIYEVKGFNPENHKELINFGKATGLRRSELTALRPSDISIDCYGNVQVHVFNGKGGKSRNVLVLPQYRDFILGFQGDGNEPIFRSVPSRLPEHVLRREYAQEAYQLLARDVTTLPDSELYICRKDKHGCIYDRKAMHMVSVMLGHNRINVIASNYL